MRQTDKPAAIGGLTEQSEVIQRLDLLVWRFSTDEIERLVTWQIRHRTRPDALDVPVAMCRLRFARWLFEHDKIDEDMGIHLEAIDRQPACEAPVDEGHETSGVSPKYLPPEYWDPHFRRGGLHRERGESGKGPLLGTVSRVGARLARVFAVLRERERASRRTGEFEVNQRDAASRTGPWGPLTWNSWSGLF